MDQRIDNVVILGGGTAGWMAASYLAKALQGTVDVTVIEAPTIPRIGVGEATVPNLQRVLFDFLEIPEEEWMRACNASFKIAVRFVNWRTPGEGEPVPRLREDGKDDHFYHPFGLLPEHDRIPLSHYWSYKKGRGETDADFCYACFKEPALMDANLAPRGRDGGRVTRYAWHFDAQLVADYLCSYAVEKLGVVRIEDEMTEAQLDEDGYITGLRLRSGRVIEGDLFVDCSGFRGALINQALKEPFLDMSDQLLCDSAVATQVPHDDARDGVQPYTSAIAMNAGWAWKIPLLTRFGTGYVYSSAFASEDEAIRNLCTLWGLDPEDHFLRLHFRVGRNRRSWVKNCVSIGLASCFLEPLESSGLYFTYAAIYQLVKHFPDRRFDPVLRDRFNREIEYMFDDTRDFIQAHFSLSPRDDTPFWKATKDLELANGMNEKLEMYKVGLPINQPVTDEDNYYGNFDAEFRNFWTNSSYYSIFAGLGVMPEAALPALTYKPASIRAADQLFDDVNRKQKELVATLPSNYEYLRGLHGNGHAES